MRSIILHIFVQALASQGDEITLNHTLFFRYNLLTSLQCLHRFAAVIRIPVVALPTEYVININLCIYYQLNLRFCQYLFLIFQTILWLKYTFFAL